MWPQSQALSTISCVTLDYSIDPSQGCWENWGTDGVKAIRIQSWDLYTFRIPPDLGEGSHSPAV